MNLVSYAQNQEDIVLYRALRSIGKGFYIDVGAQHPIVDSVTKLFYERGWHGINIDPVPQWFELLREDRPHDINLRVAAGSAAGCEKFYVVAGTGLSTADASLVSQYAEVGYSAEELEVETRTLDDICLEHHVDTVHFLKVDVEGAEEEVLRGLSFNKIRPWVVLVEAVAPVAMREGDAAHIAVETHAGWEPMLIKHGYEHVYSDGLNRFYVAKEHDELKLLLRTPPNPLDGFVRHEELIKHQRILQLDAQVRELTRVAQAVDEKHLAIDFKGMAETAENRLHRIAVLEQENARLIGEASVLQHDAAELRVAHNRVALLVQQNGDLAGRLELHSLVETELRNRLEGLVQDNARLVGEASVLQHSAAELRDAHNRVALLVKQNGDLSERLEFQSLAEIELRNRLEEFEQANAKLSGLLSVIERDAAKELSAARLEVIELRKQNAILGERSSMLELNERELKSRISYLTSDSDSLRDERAGQDARLADLLGELDQSRAALQQLLNSRSWRLTSPLRNLRKRSESRSQFKAESVVARSQGKSLPRRIGHRFLLACLRFAQRHPRLHALAKKGYRRVPVVDKHLAAFVQHNLVQAPTGAPPTSGVADSMPSGTDLGMPSEVVQVHERIRRVISDQQRQKD